MYWDPWVWYEKGWVYVYSTDRAGNRYHYFLVWSMYIIWMGPWVYAMVVRLGLCTKLAPDCHVMRQARLENFSCIYFVFQGVLITFGFGHKKFSTFGITSM